MQQKYFMSRRNISSLLITGLMILYACKEIPKEQQQGNAKEFTEANYCFRKIMLHPADSSRQDVLRMSLTVIGDSVVGSYNWFPFKKDARRGILRGIRKDSGLQLTYFYMQEGGYDTADLRVILRDGKAIIEGGEPSLGLSAVMEQVSCLE
ncbi:hypothetical protein [Zeaxanthinibacter enoshimensis]|uniref:hypothetical protein n=1 Tax=Zeaxanthinibacter enoshimensis TaxID=392009 RepID=UPI003565B736